MVEATQDAAATERLRSCPYVGPRAFAAGDPLYGRDRELGDLLDLVIAERVVLLHSPSGAGKSSLLHAGLIPRLRAEGFVVRPVLRVGLEPPEGAPAGNRYLLSALLSLGEEDPARRPAALAELAGQDLAGYLERDDAGAAAQVLVFDQFEEILTVDPADHAGKLEFFAGLGAALRRRDLWAVFAVREDHLAELEPYRKLLPTRLATTYRLDLLGVPAALAAIQAPARARGVDFLDVAARRLVDDLRLMKVPRPGGAIELRPGRHVEPVQLQVVCRQLWARLPADDREIGLEDLAALGDVDQALASYCDASLAASARRSAAPERLLRTWLQRNLVTESGLRTQVLLGAPQTGELDPRALAALVDDHLLREEQRRGMTWVELAHDRLVAPLIASNHRWFVAHLSELQRQAGLWDSQGRPDQLLLRAPPRTDEPGLTPVERRFVAQSRALRQREARERRLRRLSLGLVLLLLVGLVIFLGVYGQVRRRAQEAAEAAAAVSQRAEVQARAAAVVALSRQLAAQSALQPLARADVAALLAVAASEIAGEPEGRGHLIDEWTRAPLLRAVLRTGEAAAPYSVQASGRVAATIDAQERLRFWDLEARAALGPAKPAHAHTVAVSPTRPVAVASDVGGTALTVWGLDPVRPVAELEHAAGFVGLVRYLDFAPDGLQFAARNGEASLAVWTPAGSTYTARYIEGRAVVSALAFHPDGAHVALGYLDGGVEVRTLGGEVVASESVRAFPIWGLRFDPTGARLLAVDEFGGVGEFAVGATELTVIVRERSGPAGTPLDVTADLSAVLVRLCDKDCVRGEVMLWDRAAGRPRFVFDVGDSIEHAPLLVPDTGDLLTGHPDGTLRLWSPGRRPLLSAHARGLTAMTIGAADRLVTAGCGPTDGSGGCKGQLQLWDLATRTPVGAPLPAHATETQALQLFAGDRRLVSVDAAGEVLAWDLERGEATAAPPLPTSTLAPALAVDATGRVIAAVAGAAEIHRIEVLTGRPAAPPLPASGAVALALRGDAGQLAAATCTAGPDGCSATEVLVWDLADPSAPPRRLRAGSTTHLTFGTDGKHLAAAGPAGEVLVWGLADGAELRLRPEFATFAVADLRLSPDGERVATIACADVACASGESVTHLWSLTTGRELTAPLSGHSRFVPDATRLGPAARARRSVVFAPRGDTLITGSLDGALVWTLDAADLRAQLCALAGRDLDADEWSRFIGSTRPQQPLCAAPSR